MSIPFNRPYMTGKELWHVAQVPAKGAARACPLLPPAMQRMSGFFVRDAEQVSSLMWRSVCRRKGQSPSLR